MRIGVLTSLYPSPPRPREGIFAERRWLAMAARGHELLVVHPQPRVPLPFVAGPGGQWAELRAMPERETRSGVALRRPRYLHLPRAPRGNAKRFAAAGVAALFAPSIEAARAVGAGERAWTPEVCVLDYAWPAAAALPALAKRGVPAVLNGRGSDVLQVAGEAGLGPDLARYLTQASGWCAVSQDLVDALDRLGDAPGRGRLVPNGVDAERFRPGDRSTARESLGAIPSPNATAPLVLVVGHLIPRKDPLLALASFRASGLAAEGGRLVFIGRGPLEAELRAAASDLGEAVQLVGECTPEELARWYAASDALLLTSRREGRPNVVLEALASGRPVLATDAGGTGELLGDLEGSLATTREPEKLGAMLARLAHTEHDPEALAARVQPFTWEASAATLEALLQDVLASPAGRKP